MEINVRICVLGHYTVSVISPCLYLTRVSRSFLCLNVSDFLYSLVSFVIIVQPFCNTVEHKSYSFTTVDLNFSHHSVPIANW